MSRRFSASKRISRLHGCLVSYTNFRSAIKCLLAFVSPLDELPSKECIYGMVFRSSIILAGFTIQSVTILAQHVFVGGISAASSGHDPLSLLSTVLLSLCVVLNRSLYI